MTTLTSTNIKIGNRVRVKREQDRIGPPTCPGRVGEVVRENGFGRGDSGGLWYVKLSATTRAKEREDVFWGKDLELIAP